jgi:hypothetical protein
MPGYCPKCGAILNKNDKFFCSACGNKISIETEIDTELEKIERERRDIRHYELPKGNEEIERINNNMNFSKRGMWRTRKIVFIAFFAICISVILFLVVDADGDGLNNLSEIQHGTALFNSDSDSDDLNDGNEMNTWGTNPLNSDSDDDGLDDYAEIMTHESDPLNADNDDDGLKDGAEVQAGTNLFDTDTDDDDYQDGSDPHPLEHEWKYLDSDTDGWTDYTEYYETDTDRFNSDTDGDDYSDSSDPHPLEHEWKYLDSDTDGWTDYTEYYETNTDRLKSDTDGDGAPDPMDANPRSAARVITRNYAWDYPSDWTNAISWTWTITASSDLYDYEYQLPRLTSWDEWSEYTNDPVIGRLAPGLKSAAADQGFDYYQTVDYVLAFVQSLPYTTDDVTTGADEYPRYPVETIVDGGGDCEDTSFLAAGILKAMDYDVCLISLPGHLAVGVSGDNTYAGTYYNSDGKYFYYCETTGEGWTMGQIPDDFQEASAQLITVS